MTSDPAGGRGGGGAAGDPLTGTAAGSLTGAGAGLGACGDKYMCFLLD